MKCDTCLNSRLIVSENGLHAVCWLSTKAAMMCLTEEKDRYIENPMRKAGDER